MVSLGEISDEGFKILHKCEKRETKNYTPEEMLKLLVEDVLYCKGLNDNIEGIGINCGGPLDSKRGVILSPPNLIGWDNIYVTDYFYKATGIKSWLCNDANAGALAEWKLGAGRGCSSMVFLTFGTGFGAGLILDGRLYSGISDMAGEIGHIRLSDFGPVGFGKAGSAEGYCSGGGIAQLAKMRILEMLQIGLSPALCPTIAQLEGITAEKVGIAAKAGDSLALEILKESGIYLGKALSLLIDILNPERIVIGSIFARCYDEIWPWAYEVIKKEALPISLGACQVLPCELSESIGDVAGLVIAAYNLSLEAKP